MNNRIEILRAAVTKTVKLLANQNIKVMQRGDKAFVRYDNAGRPESVTLPVIPDDASEELILAIQGFLDHEVAHILKTDPAVMKYFQDEVHKARRSAKDSVKIQQLHSLWNIIEDCRIEREMQREFRGSGYNLKHLHEFFLANLTSPAIAGNENKEEVANYLVPPIFRAMVGQDAFRDYLDSNTEHADLIEKGREFYKVHGPQIMRARTSWDALNIAKEVHARMYPEPPEQNGGSGADDDSSESFDTGEESSNDKNQSGSDKNSGSKDKKESNEKEKSEPEEAPAEDEENDSGGDSDDDGAEQQNQDESDGANGDGERDDDENGEKGSGDSDSDDADENDGTGEGDDGDGDGDDGDGDDGDDDADSEGDADSENGGDKTGGDDQEGDQKDEQKGDDDDEESPTQQPGEGETTSSYSNGDSDEESDRDGREPGGAGGGIGTNGFVEFDPTKELEGDFDEGASQALSAAIGEVLDDQDYLIYSTDYDQIFPLKVPATTDTKWLIDAVKSTTGTLQKHLERIIAARSQSVFSSGFRSGRLHSASLHRLSVKDDRVFRRKQENKSTETAISLLIDCSGSMMDTTRSRKTKSQVATEAAFAFSQVLDRLKVSHEVLGFTTNNNFRSLPPQYYEDMHEFGIRHGGLSRMDTLTIPILKQFHERLTPDVVKRFAGLQSAIQFNSNVDGESVEIALRRLSERREARKVLFVFSDGLPAASSSGNRHQSQFTKLKSTVAQWSKAGYEIIGVGIASEAVQHFYPKHVVIHNVEELPNVMMEKLHEILLPA